jgi:prophage DNA circulation protein
MLQAASFRGVPFAVTGSDTTVGRRIALHQYPGKDAPWAEDMGRSARRFRLRGFVLDGDILIGGQSIDLQRKNLIAATEKSGTGTLIMPTLGAVTVALERCSISEGLGANSFSDVDFEFVESGAQTFPSAQSSTTTAATKAAKQLKKAKTNAFAKAIATIKAGSAALNSEIAAVTSPIRAAEAVVAQAFLAAKSWVSVVKRAIIDATAMYRVAANLIGSFGRFAAGGNVGVIGSNTSPYAAGTSVADIVPIASTARETALAAADAFAEVVTDAGLSIPDDVSTSATAMIDALLACCADPADAIRLILSLMAHVVTGAQSDAASAIDQMVLRTLAAALATAVSQYQPSSADDAAARITDIGGALYTLMTAAADAGEDDAFAALRDVRGAIVQDLRARGATLATLRTFNFALALPALTLAQSIYADATRADELVRQANPPHPLFMPASFTALSS